MSLRLFGNSRFTSRVPKETCVRPRAYGRGAGVGRGRGVGVALPPGVAVAVAVGVGVGLGPHGLTGQLKICVEAREPRISSMPHASHMLLVPSVSLAALRRAVMNGGPSDQVLLTGSEISPSLKNVGTPPPPMT